MAQGEIYRREIREQPAVLQALLRGGRAGIEAIAEDILRVRPVFGLLAARGSSDNAARYGSYVLGVRNRLMCALAAPSVFTAYASPPTLRGSLTIALSQSGQSPDVVQVVREAASQGALTVGITNDENSPLAQAARWVIPLHAGVEAAVPATKTYTAQLMAVAMLSAALERNTQAWAVLDGVAEAAQNTIDLNPSFEGVEALAEMQQVVVIGRGFNYASACEIALKISETSSVLALPYSLADFLHGPITMLGPGTHVLLVAPSGVLDAEVAKFIRALKQCGARLIAISDNKEVLRYADMAFAIPSTPEWISPICAAVMGQLFSLALSDTKSHDADAPRGLSKVTLTY